MDEQDVAQLQELLQVLEELHGQASYYNFDPTYAGIYVFFAFCFLLPPNAFVHAGVTIDGILASYLGDEGRSFCEYHLRRTFVTLLVCVMMPFGLVLLYASANQSLSVMLPNEMYQIAPLWSVYCAVSILVALGGVSMAFWWKLDGWRAHPFALRLRLYAAHVGISERLIKENIDIEFSTIDKFTVGLPGRQIIVTESWIMRTTLFGVDIAHQADAHVELLDAHEVDVTYNNSFVRQFLKIRVNERHASASGAQQSALKSFTFQLNAVDYEALRTRLSAPIDNVRNIIVEASVTEQFVRVFAGQIDRNPTWQVPSGAEYEEFIEPCVGCARHDSDVKLVKHCDAADSQCRQCFCRAAMWCARCMAIWFATRQDDNALESWLSGTAPCPTCRAPFCVLDVCHVDSSLARPKRATDAANESDEDSTTARPHV